MSTWCPSCCANCFLNEIHSDSPTKSPFSFNDLLPVGSVFVRFKIETQHKICDHRHAQDGWHYFEDETIIQHLSDTEEISFWLQIHSLVKNRTIIVTYRAAQDSPLRLALRIYLIPSDIVKREGSTHGSYLRNLLARLSRSENSWNGHEPTEDSERTLLISDHNVCILGSYSLCHH